MIRFDPRELERLRNTLRAVPDNVYRNLRAAFVEDAVEWEKVLGARLRGGNPLHQRTGQLARSIRREIQGGSLRDLRLRGLSVGAPHAIRQELGGEVRPRRVRNLTIPIDDNLFPSGVVRFPSARALIAREGHRKGSPKRLPEVRFLKARNGKTYIVRDTGTDVQFLFVLAKRTFLPTDESQRMGFFLTWRTQAPARARRRAVALSNALRDAAGGGA